MNIPLPEPKKLARLGIDGSLAAAVLYCVQWMNKVEHRTALIENADTRLARLEDQLAPLLVEHRAQELIIERGYFMMDATETAEQEVGSFIAEQRALPIANEAAKESDR